MSGRSLEWRDGLLAATALLAVLAYPAAGFFQTDIPAPWQHEKMMAANKARAAMDAIRREREHRGLGIDRVSDINATGLIGRRWSGMTTTLGALEAKRTSTNPDFAALAVALLKDCGVRSGDRVAVSLSGSFPALNIAVLVALDVLGVEPVVVSSLGASTWGANEPELTWLDMEAVLARQGLIGSVSLAVSLGGGNDSGGDMEPAIRSMLRARIRGQGLLLLEDPDLTRNVAARMDLYLQGRAPSCLVNVGGNLASSAASPVAPGVLRPEAAGPHIGGVIGAFLERGIPVIHLLDLRELTLRYGLPFDPLPLPEPGTGRLYRETVPSRWFVATFLLAQALLLGLYVCLGRKIRTPRAEAP